MFVANVMMKQAYMLLNTNAGRSYAKNAMNFVK